MTITKDTIGTSYEEIKKFNDISSNLEGNLVEKVDNQLGFIFEELSETIEAFENKDAVGLLDGAVDAWVTVGGLLQKLEAAGFDVASAIRRVDENNLSKFVPTENFKALVIPKEYKATLNERHNVLVLKDQNGKIRKPHNFVPVSLGDLVPDNFFGE